MSSTFVREIERSDESVLRIHQEDVGDVGVVVWDAALVLLFYLDKENDRQKGDFLHGRRIVELGAGTGVVSVSAATRGAFVIASDLQCLVDLMKRNERENRAAIQAAGGKLECLALDWAEELPVRLTRTLRMWSGSGGGSEGGSGGRGDPDDDDGVRLESREDGLLTLSKRGEAETTAAPTSTAAARSTAAPATSATPAPTTASMFGVTFPDMILVSDCVYYESSVAALVKTLTSLTGPNTLVLVSIEDRTSPEKVRVRNKFLSGVGDAGFQIARVGFEDMDETFRSPDIHILMMKRKQ